LVERFSDLNLISRSVNLRYLCWKTFTSGPGNWHWILQCVWQTKFLIIL